MIVSRKNIKSTTLFVVFSCFIALLTVGCDDPNSPTNPTTNPGVNPGVNENGPFGDVTPNVVKLKTFVVRKPDVRVYAEAREESDIITDDMFRDQYSQELDNIMFGDDKTYTYFTLNSFGKMKMESSFQKEVIVIDSYPETQPNDRFSQPRVINVNEVNEKIAAQLSRDDMIDNDVIMVYLLCDPDLRLERQGVQSSYTLIENGMFVKSVRFTYYSWLSTTNFIAEVEAVQGEPLNALNTVNPIRATPTNQREGTATAPVKYTNLHEIGHALGLRGHADFTQRDDYGNRADIMGLGIISVAINPGLKDRLNWLSEETTSTLEGAVGTTNVTLVAVHGAENGTRVVKLATGTPDLYYYIYFYGKDDPFLAANLDPGKTTLYGENGQGISIVSDDGLSNRVQRAANSDFDTFVFLPGRSFTDANIEVTNIQVDEENRRASFDVRNFVNPAASISVSSRQATPYRDRSAVGVSSLDTDISPCPVFY